MANFLQYLDQFQYDSFYDIPLSTLDILALVELAYLPFDNLVTEEMTPQHAIRLDRFAQSFKEAFKDGYPPLSMMTKERLELLDKLATSQRFKHIKVFGYVNDYSLENQKQFAAVCYKIQQDHYLLVFRGTDDTIIGWKEDFHMAYMQEIPAQLSAKDYLQQLLEHIDGKVTIAGHSKGGNLAIYASSQVAENLQPAIQSIYAFDAPGLHPSILASLGFARMEHRIHSFIPQNSIVGMMLETPKHATVIKSKAFGLAQHITFTWEVNQGHLVPVKEVTSDSQQVDKTLKTWIAQLPPEDVKQFVDLFFGLFIQAGIYRFSDITVDTFGKLQKVIQTMENRTPEEKEMMERLIRLLIDTRVQVWKETLPDLPQLKEIKLPKKLQNLSDLHLQEKLPKLPKVELPDSLRNLLPDKPEKDKS